MLPDRLTKIDETNRDQYYFLGPDDRCYFFGDFFSGKGWKGGDTNQLIKNFKRTPEEIRTSAKAQQLQFYKDKAITEIAAALRKAFGPAGVAQRTFVPIPPSKASDHPDYCDRLEKTLRKAFATYDVGIRLLLRQTASTESDHRSGEGRMSYEDLLAITELDKSQLSSPLRAEIVLFDDVLTSGKHYKVAKTRIRELFPDDPLLGVFVARSIHPSPFEDLDAMQVCSRPVAACTSRPRAGLRRMSAQKLDSVSQLQIRGGDIQSIETVKEFYAAWSIGSQGGGHRIDDDRCFLALKLVYRTDASAGQALLQRPPPRERRIGFLRAQQGDSAARCRLYPACCGGTSLRSGVFVRQRILRRHDGSAFSLGDQRREASPLMEILR